MDLIRINALNAIHLYMKIHNNKMILLSNAFQKIKFVKILLTFMLEMLTIAIIKINAFLNAKITQLFTDYQKFANIVLRLILIFQFLSLITLHVYHLVIMK